MATLQDQMAGQQQQQPNVIQGAMLSPQMRRQALLQNIIGNIGNLDRGNPTVNPLSSLQDARSKQVSLQNSLTNQEYQRSLIEQQRQKQLQAEEQARRQAALQQRMAGMQPEEKVNFMLQSGMVDDATTYVDALKKRKDLFSPEAVDQLEGLSTGYRDYLTSQGLAPSKKTYDDYMENYKSSGVNVTQTVGGETPTLEFSSAELGKFQENQVAPVQQSLGNLERINQMASLVQRSGEKSLGLQGKFRAMVAPLAALAGVQTQAMDDAQILDVLFGKEAGKLRLEVVGSGSVSNYEQKILRAASGRNISSEDALKEMLRYNWEKNQRTINKKRDNIEGLRKENAKYRYLFDPVPEVETPEWLQTSQEVKDAIQATSLPEEEKNDSQDVIEPQPINPSMSSEDWTPTPEQQNILNKYLR